ncbi:MAG TPA: adenosylmethionine--8-amino-7-oxononanoate transaminase [Candidatus Acidoferrales bacterium]|nr:adenosylmethionine--8-amino-7-oxononanoate transaminase [Candidatus Acidoferrales bacterium]
MSDSANSRGTTGLVQDALKIWHPFTRVGVDAPPLEVVRGEGPWLYTADGRRILDAISSWWVNLHGHAHPRIAEAIAQQARQLEHVLLAGFTHEPVERLAHELREFLPPALEHIFFSDDGSTAVEVALKLALQYWSNCGQPEKREIVALEHGYHGDTAGAMSVSDDSTFTSAFAPMRFPVQRAHAAYCYRCPVGLERETCHIECADSLEKILADRGGQVAAVIVEPLLQGAGGMIVHPLEYLQRVREITARHGVLLIADEVLTGFGRTGKMFATELAGVVPDLMCLSKGLTGGFLPMGATLLTNRIFEAFGGDDPARAFWHGHSYTGNPLACAAALVSLEVFRTEPVFERIAAIAEVHAERLPRLRAFERVGDTRRIGTVAAIELLADDSGYLSSLRPKLYNFFLSRNILLRPLGNVIYVLPPYCTPMDELHRVYDVAEEAIRVLA